MKRTLTLRKETLNDLSASDLARVVGGRETLDVTACTRATLTFCPDYYCTGTI